ncbi:lysozyme inhibitor LprI family protein [Acinetobacter nosocomialis]|uniref:lysozyme inhibitor LprI family protein n=1 Tax=Acinetobacter nosocomialis TaxID=106654 RepID=UPI0029DB3966|nr:lysozyme inhibitor LprI family protein [Acinetobacter nosocomialis]MDX7880449.1 lysozyme inhibitor LprI family protein [Acinetobacter nosocomialis]
MKKTLLIAFLALCNTGLYAQDCEIKFKSPALVADCYEKESLKKVQAKLNQLALLSKEQVEYNPNVLSELNTSQKDWLKYRDSYCRTYSNYHSEINNHANCIIDLNNKRAEQLQADIDAN